VNIAKTQSQSYISTIVRYRLKEIVQEVLDAESRDRLLIFGLDVKRDYQEYLGTKHWPKTREGMSPYLMSVHMEEVKKDANKSGTLAYNHAHIGPPRFGFRINEQEVLKRALHGETDDEIGCWLNLSLPTVKRRWQSIYAKVEAMDPELLGDPAGSKHAEETGAKQRRRYLLKSLKDHPEEFWPTKPLKKNTKGFKKKGN
jgi:DNA-binding CsgD family transcriptional regulator